MGSTNKTANLSLSQFVTGVDRPTWLGDYNTDMQKIDEGVSDARTPTGSIILFSNVTPPDGWLPCDGAAVSRVTYADLFATIGTLYGTGDGSTTFNVPNMTGRFPLGYNANLGAIGGASTHQLTEAQLPAIARGITYLGGASPVYLGGTGSETGYQLSYTQKSNALTSSDITVKFGGGQAFNKMPPHIALAYIIKT